MKLAVFDAAGSDEIGIVRDDRILSASRAVSELPVTMIELIARMDEFKDRLSEAASGDDGWLPLDQVKLRPPVARPGKILAIGLNYADHIKETGREPPQHQMWFMKASSSIAGPYDAIQIPKASPETVDYESELVVVIGKGGRHISREAAPGAVFGYCVGNDVSVRAWQRHSPQWSIAKSFDTHSPIGPWITLSDELPDPHGLKITCMVDADQRQTSNTSNMVFDVWAQIEYLSQAMTLEPGDLIFTGTPGGVGWPMTPPGFLRPGSTCRCEIEKLGYIEGRCEEE